MRMFGLLVALIAGVGAVWILMEARSPPDAATGSGKVTVKAIQKYSSATPAGAIPPPAAAAARTSAPARPSRQSTLMAEVVRARNYKALYERLQAKPDRTPEETYALAEILALCGKGIAPVATHRQRLGGDDRRKRFAESLSPNDPLRDRRIAAFDEINHDFCEGLEGLDVKASDVRALVATAAASGDPKARASQVAQEIRESARRPDGKGPLQPMTISEAQLDTLRSLLGSDDPDAVMAAMRALQMPFANLSLRAGPEQATVDTAALYQAAHFVACDLGTRCGADAPELAYACALNGYCTAADYREHAYQNVLSASSAASAQLYYEQLQRARAGDWSYFSFHRGQSPRAAIFSRPAGK
jgi:hypothetical protein